MPDPKGDRLIVNLGASQARKRLRGFGCGVRKVQTGGKGQAVIIHTAKGRNLYSLKNLFADVGYECVSDSQTVEAGGIAAGKFTVGDIVVDLSDPVRGRGIVAEDATKPDTPPGSQCLVVDFENLGRVIVFTGLRLLERVDH